MTEKQFTFEFDGGAWGVPVFYNNNKKLSFDEVVDCLNNLHEENQALKKDRWICLDCEYQGYSEIGCLCEKKDGWIEHKTECDNFKEKYNVGGKQHS